MSRAIEELNEQRAAIMESLCESIFEGSIEAVEFFRFMLYDIEGGIKALNTHMQKTK